MKRFNKSICILLITSFISGALSIGASATTRRIVWGAANSAGSGVRVRSGPGLNHDVLAHAARGDTFVIIERTDDEWYRVNYNGTVGYVSASLLDRPRSVADFSANGKIAGNGVNVREKPTVNSSALGTFDKDTVMSIIGLNEGWYKVHYDNITGYVRSDLMDVVNSDGALGSTPTSSSVFGKVVGSKVNMREKPYISAAILGTFAQGTIMNVLGIDNGWYKIQYNDKIGYMSSDYIQVSSIPPALSGFDAATHPSSSYVAPSGSAPSYNAVLGQQIVDYALGFVGSSYVSGGASPTTGFDCSGFVYYIYRQFGINLTRNASGQYRDNGTHINPAELAPGDLVFTSSNGTTVTHVGIYIGNSKMVHASTTTTGVIISNIDNANYSKTVFGAKRIV